MNWYNGFSPSERERGARMIRDAVKRGELPNQMAEKCVLCGQDKGIRHYHCEDYSVDNVIKDAKVVCWRCHMMIHNRFKHPLSFSNYMIDVVLEKKQFAPVFKWDDWETLEQHYID